MFWPGSGSIRPPFEDAINETRGQWVLGHLMLLVETELALSQVRPIERYHILGDPLLRIDAGPPHST